MRHLTWRGLSMVLSLTCVGVLACTPAASPSPPAPAQKSEAPPAAAPAQPAAPAQKTEAPAAAPAATTAWDQIVEGAKKEAVLTVATGTGTGPQKFMAKFKEKYPWLEVQVSGFKASDIGPRLISEQRNGLFAWDIQVGTGFNTVASVLQPADATGDIRPLIADLPADVKDESKWAGGFALYRDPSFTDSFITSFNVAGGYWVNRDQIKAGELTTFDQLLDPKYRGKMVIYNPTQTTGGSQDLAPMLASRGEPFIRKLFDDQKLLIVEVKRQATEWVVTGRYPIGLGMDEEVIQEFQTQGIGKNMEEVREPESAYLRAAGATLIKNPPHPNATRVFLYWLLSQEGQDAFASLYSPTATTRRLDVKAYAPKDTPDFNHMKDYQVWTGTPAGDVWLQKVVDIVNAK